MINYRRDWLSGGGERGRRGGLLGIVITRRRIRDRPEEHRVFPDCGMAGRISVPQTVPGAVQIHVCVYKVFSHRIASYTRS